MHLGAAFTLAYETARPERGGARVRSSGKHTQPIRTSRVRCKGNVANRRASSAPGSAAAAVPRGAAGRRDGAWVLTA